MAKKKRLVVGNWKMHPLSYASGKKIFDTIKRKVSRARRTEIVLCPPILYLGALARSYGGTTLHWGGQDVSVHSKEGAHTGEVSASMLKNMGVSYALVGHSERRKDGETSVVVSKKASALLDVGVNPIVCIGEAERDMGGHYLRFVEEELRASLRGISKKQARHLIVAYEPIWAIGKKASDAITPHDAYEMSLFIRKILVKMYGRKIGFSILVLYGGSVEPDNDSDLIGAGGIDGFLVGHESLVPDDFVSIVKAVDHASSLR